jgi:transposase
MKLYGGIDLHSNNSVINLIDENSNVVLKKRISNNLGVILRLLGPYRDTITGLVVEST